MIIAIDYDGTWTEDPDMFETLTTVMRMRSHRVLVVTARVSGEAEVERKCGPFVDRILFSGRTPKRDYCHEQGELVDVWIDDMPDLIISHHPLLIGAGA